MSQALSLVTRQGDRIAIVSGLRTPFARQATAFHGVPAIELGKMVVVKLKKLFHFLLVLIGPILFGVSVLPLFNKVVHFLFLME